MTVLGSSPQGPFSQSGACKCEIKEPAGLGSALSPGPLSPPPGIHHLHSGICHLHLGISPVTFPRHPCHLSPAVSQSRTSMETPQSSVHEIFARTLPAHGGRRGCRLDRTCRAEPQRSADLENHCCAHLPTSPQEWTSTQSPSVAMGEFTRWAWVAAWDPQRHAHAPGLEGSGLVHSVPHPRPQPEPEGPRLEGPAQLRAVTALA